MAEKVTVRILRKQLAAITELLSIASDETQAPYEAYVALGMAIRMLEGAKNELTAR